MENNNITVIINRLFDVIEKLIPEYMKNPEDKCISNGNLAACIIDENGVVHGKMFGTDKPRLRQSYKVAWTKASQVLLTGVKPGSMKKWFLIKRWEKMQTALKPLI